jgi:hypothetical protein
MADPDLFGLINLLALGWIAVSLWRRRANAAIRLSAALYLLTAPIFVPGVADVFARVVSADGAWRYTFFLPLAAILSFADFGRWVLQEAGSRQRVGGLLLGSAMLALVFVSGNLSVGKHGDGRLSEQQESLLDVLDESTRELDDPATVLADRRLSQFIPTFVANANPIFFPFVADAEELAVDGVNRRREHTRIIEQPGSFSEILEVVRFWDAEFVVLERGSIDQRRPRKLVLCYETRNYQLLVIRDELALCSRSGE